MNGFSLRLALKQRYKGLAVTAVETSQVRKGYKVFFLYSLMMITPNLEKVGRKHALYDVFKICNIYRR